MFGHRVFLRMGELPEMDIAGLFKDTYELVNCTYSFTQGVDRKGKTQTEVTGGILHLTLPNLPPDFITRWALDTRKYENGVVVICDADNIPLEKVYFREAACVSMEIEYTQAGKGYVSTKITVNAQKIKIGSIDFENKWIS